MTGREALADALLFKAEVGGMAEALHDADEVLRSLAARGFAVVDVDGLEVAWRAHALDRGPEGWPHLRMNTMPGDGPQYENGCDDLCAEQILRRVEPGLPL